MCVCSLCSHKKVIKKTSYNIKDFGNPTEGFCYTKFFNGLKKKKKWFIKCMPGLNVELKT